MYKKSNTKNENIVKIKTIIDKWLDEVGLTSKTMRTATIVNFRKAIISSEEVSSLQRRVV